MPLPAGPPPNSFCYVIEDAAGDVHLIDPGSDLDSNWALLAGALHAVGSSVDRVASITATHLHPDHLGLAERVRAASGARVLMHAAEQETLDWVVAHGPIVPDYRAWGVPADQLDTLIGIASHRHTAALTADALIADGDVLPIPGREIRVLHTPGHTAGHVVLRDVESALIFTGDHVLPEIFPGIGLGGQTPDPLGDYVDSLARVELFDDHEVCPGHGHRFLGLAQRCAQSRAHQLSRSDEVARILTAAPDASVWEVAKQVSWTDGWEGLRSFRLAAALAQTHMRISFIRGHDTMGV
jgi:glyoxylase-like metal-dependent hydrolase (beta-lactamase superfamily II)